MEMRTDVHQHLWTEPLVASLARRSSAPRVMRDGARWMLELDGEPATALDVPGDGVAHRAALVHLDGLDRALVALSSPLGIETLAPDDAQPLLDAYHEGVSELPDDFAAWGAVALRDPDAPAAASALLDRGAVGLNVPAGALATPHALEALGPVLARLEDRDAPLLVHPGPAAGRPGDPDWWPALTDYVAGQNAAWHAWTAIGRRAHPRLRVVFAGLAGLAPLHVERLAARGGPACRARDENLFYDTSTYGPRAISAMAAVVGLDSLVHGSDRPVVSPPAAGGWVQALGEAAWHAMTRTNPARLLGSRRRPQEV